LEALANIYIQARTRIHAHMYCLPASDKAKAALDLTMMRPRQYSEYSVCLYLDYRLRHRIPCPPMYCRVLRVMSDSLVEMIEEDGVGES